MKYSYVFKQLRDCPSGCTERLFLDYEATIKQFGSVDLFLYQTVDNGVVEALGPEAACERLFRIYNTDPPEGYSGRSMSVSDVIFLETEQPPTWPPVPNPRTAWYCDSIGFRRIL